MKDKVFNVVKGAFSILMAVALCVGLWSMFNWVLFERKPDKPDPEKKSQLSDEILAYILDLRIENSYIVYAQAQLESAHFTSDIFMENNNLFGMKVAERRPTTAIGVNRGHAVYKSWRESVIDYALMQAAYYRGLDEKTYLDKICSVYATDTTYRKRLEAMKND